MDYRAIHDELTGQFLGIERSYDDGSKLMFAPDSRHWPEFERWNAQQQEPIVIADKPPYSPSSKQIEAARKFSVALQLIKNIPESFETGTAQQQFMWACKHLFKRVAQEID